MQSESVVSSALEVEDVVFSVLSWLGPDLLFVYRRVTKTFKRTIDNRFVPAPLSMDHFCSPLSMFAWAINEGGCPEKLRWFVEQGPDGTISTPAPYEDLLASAREAIALTSPLMNVYNDKEGDMKGLLVREGQDEVYERALADFKAKETKQGDGDNSTYGDSPQIHPIVYSGIPLTPLPAVSVKGAPLGTGLGRTTSLSVCQDVLEKQFGARRIDLEDDDIVDYEYKNESEVFAYDAVKFKLTKLAKLNPNHQNYHHKLNDPDFNEWMESHDAGDWYGSHPKGCINSITNMDLDTLFCRAGVLAASSEVYADSRVQLRTYLEDVLRDTVAHSEYTKSKVVTSRNIQCGLLNRVLVHKVYGFGHPKLPPSSFSNGIYKVLKKVHPHIDISAEGLSVCTDYVADTLVGILDAAVRLVDLDAENSSHEGKSEIYEWSHSEYGSTVVTVNNGGKDMPQLVLDVRDIQVGVQQSVGGELSKHALSEGTKATTVKSTSSEVGWQVSPEDINRRAGLVFCVFGTVLAASRTHKGVLLTADAATYLTGALEYLAAEILELAGNAASDNQVTTITPRHICLAIRFDAELDACTLKTAIRDGGIFPHIHKAVAERLSRSDHVEHFIEVFIKMLEKTEEKILIDPRDGFHKRLLPDEPYMELIQYHEGRLTSVPELDALCSLSRGHRQVQALEDLNASQRKALEHFYCDGFQIQQKRLHDIRRSQRCCREHALGTEVFRRVVRELSLNFKTNLLFSDEAYDCLQVAAEAHLCELYELANLNALHCQRVRINNMDIQLARRECGDRR